jgi:hypothetical protein
MVSKRKNGSKEGKTKEGKEKERGSTRKRERRKASLYSVPSSASRDQCGVLSYWPKDLGSESVLKPHKQSQVVSEH